MHVLTFTGSNVMFCDVLAPWGVASRHEPRQNMPPKVEGGKLGVAARHPAWEVRLPRVQSEALVPRRNWWRIPFSRIGSRNARTGSGRCRFLWLADRVVSV